jgi:hypothetical protein
MKYLPSLKTDATERMLVFQIQPGEETLLLALLRLYPVLDNSHHRLSKDPKMAGSAEQRLLEDSMAQQQAAHRKKLDELFRTPQRYIKETPGERRLVLAGGQYEWLLQVLNDIRVGSWVKLGCPDPDKALPASPPRLDARSLQAMHLSGQFQMALLEAVK